MTLAGADGLPLKLPAHQKHNKKWGKQKPRFFIGRDEK